MHRMRLVRALSLSLFLVDRVTSAASGQDAEEPPQCTGPNVDGEEGSCSSGYSETDNIRGGEDEGTSQDQQQQQQQQPPDAKNLPVEPPREQSQCGLYMAESSIPHAGWGIYTGKKLSEGRVIQPVDVVIDTYDVMVHQRFQEGPRNKKDKKTPWLPAWLMDQYHWSPEIVKTQFSADIINSVLPGFGMLANSHTGLVNAENLGSEARLWSYVDDEVDENESSSMFKKKKNRNDATRTRSRVPPSTGAFSHLHGLSFIALETLEPGHEIFVEYGDHWFIERADKFGHIPVSLDFEAADRFLQRWSKVLTRTTKGKSGDDVDSFANSFWNFTLDLVFEVWDLDSPQPDPNAKNRLKKLPPLHERSEEEANQKLRFRAALPNTGEEAVKWLQKWPTKPTASATVPNLVRSLDWLDENGYCLDNIQVRNTEPAGREGKYVSKGKGAFATRPLKNGTVVAPAPLIHMSRDHLRMRWMEDQDENTTSVVWEGYQLLLNYCYGHKSSSLLFFPYAPAVNLINHGRPANVALRWSMEKMGQPEMLSWSTKQVVESTSKSGLMMEIYALRDVEEGEEILLDYGDGWEESWEQHMAEWTPPVNADDLKSYLMYDQHDELFTVDDPRHPPSYIQTRCWIEYDPESKPDKQGFYQCFDVEAMDLEATVPCTLLEVGEDPETGDPLFKVEAVVDEGYENERKVKLKDLYWQYITYVERPYTNDQQLRHSFRHEIELRDELVPSNWRDLVSDPPRGSGEETSDNESCGLYMAESAIPGSGLGMYTAREISKGEKVFYPDLSIVAEDPELNFKLRQWFEGDFSDDEKTWLMEHYWWTSSMILSLFDAEQVQNILPGVGMLANSHTGLFNTEIKTAEQTVTLHRSRNAGAGASTSYHDVQYIASLNIEAGAEIFAEYTDSYFEGREDLGSVPLSTDYIKADRILKQFVSDLGGADSDSEKAREAWDRLLSTHGEDARLLSALPKNLDDISRILEVGTAEYSVPNRVRSTAWLEKNGKCLDNIRPGRSTIREADQGAFATRQIRKGDVIAPMPVVQLHRGHMDIFNSDDVEDPNAKVTKEGAQLLLNYVYGHPESNLLLFPYSPVVNYVNHNASTYNAELRWSSLPSHRADWFNRPPDELVDLDHAGLIMELVAMRDIAAGEEVLLNYGDLWDRSWHDYTRRWEPYRNAEKYVSAAQLNKRAEWLRTPKELETDPYPPNVFLGCFVNLDAEKVSVPSRWKYTPGLFSNGHEIMPCEVVERVENDPDDAYNRRDSVRPVDALYTVKVFPPSEEDEEGDEKPMPEFFMSHVTRKAIRFFDEIYTSDQFLKDVFRHEIHLPDEMVPPAWRDRKDSATGTATTA